MPKVKGRGKTLRTRTIHPSGRPDIYLHVDVKKKAGPRRGHTVAGKVHHKGEGSARAL